MISAVEKPRPEILGRTLGEDRSRPRRCHGCSGLGRGERAGADRERRTAHSTGARRGELCALQVRDVDLDSGVLHIAFSYVVVDGRRVRKDTKTHQDRYLAIDQVTCAMIREHLDTIRAKLAAVGLELSEDAFVFSNDPMGASPWNPDWATHKASDLAAAAGVKLNIKGLRHYTASQLLAARFDLRNTAARLGHGSGGATTLRHYADPVSEVDRRAAVYLAQLTAGSAAESD